LIFVFSLNEALYIIGEETRVGARRLSNIDSMKLSGILKKIQVSNSATDSYISIVLELDSNIDFNLLHSLKHKPLKILIEEQD